MTNRKKRGGALVARIREIFSDISDFYSRRKHVSLYVELAASAAFGTLIAAVIYIILQIFTSYYINTELLSPERMAEREKIYVSELQEYADEAELSLGDADRLLTADIGRRYVRIAIYSDIPLLDDATDASIDMKEYAESHGMHLLHLTDGTVMVRVNDFTEYYYYALISSANFFISLGVLAVLLIDRVRKIIKRVKRLESDVAVVAYSDMNHKISVDGKNDISKLSEGVETMRLSMLENIRKEQEARNANTELITSLSHDIRTPLTVMLGSLEMIKEKGDSEEVKQYAEVIEKTAMRLKQLSDDMFRYFLAYGNTGEEVHLETYDVETLLGQMLTEHILLLGESGYVVEFERDALRSGESASVITDADNLMRIFDNVFSNIYKYADRSEPVSISVTRLGDLIAIEVKNKILERTEHVESNRIGLRTCARLAEFIAESFESGEQDSYFTARLVLRMALSDATASEEKNK